MEVLRTIHKTENNYLNISIPLNFQSIYVEVIVLPYSKKDELSNENTTFKNEFQEMLLNGPTMTTEDEAFFIEKQKKFTQWK